MAFVVETPDQDPNTPTPNPTMPTTPGTPGYVPPVTEGAVLAVVTTSSNYAFTSDQIRMAGGPWPSFKVRVTPINDNGSGAYQEARASNIRITEDGNDRVTQDGSNRIGE